MGNYNHQPFSVWLLDEDALTASEHQSLREHLQNCEPCRSLSVSLKEMEHQLHSAPMFAPAEGFSLRWVERQQAEQARQLLKLRRQTLTTLLFSIGGAMALFTILAVALLPLLREPQPLLLEGLIRLTWVYSLVSEMVGAATTLVRVTLGLVPPTMWIALTVAFGGLCALWIMALRRVASPRRVIR